MKCVVVLLFCAVLQTSFGRPEGYDWRKENGKRSSRSENLNGEPETSYNFPYQLGVSDVDHGNLNDRQVNVRDSDGEINDPTVYDIKVDEEHSKNNIKSHKMEVRQTRRGVKDKYDLVKEDFPNEGYIRQIHQINVTNTNRELSEQNDVKEELIRQDVKEQYVLLAKKEVSNLSNNDHNRKKRQGNTINRGRLTYDILFSPRGTYEDNRRMIISLTEPTASTLEQLENKDIMSEDSGHVDGVKDKGKIPPLSAYSAFVGDTCATGLVRFSEMCVEVDK